MHYFEEVKRELFKFKHLGEEITPNGALLIGRAPHVARQAWLHSIYPALSDQEVGTLERELNMPIPESYRWFLQNGSNGLGVFVSSFYLYGLRKVLGRTIEASRQPYSPDIANIDERPKNAKKSYFFIGGYDWDGSNLYIDTETNLVHFSDRWDATSLSKWNSFEEMLVSEIKRLVRLFDENGKIIDAKLYTTPVARERA
jgi:hypothetical protein